MGFPREFAGCGWLWFDPCNFDSVNTFMLARREISCRAEICITADSRYRLFVNGTYVCGGPARGYPRSYPFDRVDIAPFLRKGRNCLAVLAHQFGVGTYQSVYEGCEGLLVGGRVAGVDVGTKPKAWTVRKCPGHTQDMIRRSLQMGFQENFSSRLVEADWQLPGSGIRPGRNGWGEGVIHPLGAAPWFALKPALLHLDRLSIRIPAGRGHVALGLERNGGRVSGRLAVPAGVSGAIAAPGARKRVGPGVHRFVYREEER